MGCQVSGPLRLLSAISASFLSCILVSAGQEDDFCDWPRVDGRNLTQEQFDNLYFEKSPVVLMNLIDEWPAYAQGRWDEEQILEKYGSTVFNSSHLAPNNRADGTFLDGTLLQDQLNSDSRSSWFVYPHHPMAVDMLSRGDFTVPSLLRAYASGNGPCISIGRRQGNIAHDHEGNFLAQVRGRKRWLVRPRGLWKDKFPGISRPQRMRQGPCAPPPPWPDQRHCVVKDGEIAYLPGGWLHETCSLDNFNIGVAYVGAAPRSVITKPKSMDAWVMAAGGDLASLQKALEGLDLQDKQSVFAPAVAKGHVAIVNHLLGLRADASNIRLKDDDLWKTKPPLHLAAVAGHAQLFPILVAHGAKLTQKDKHGMLAVHYAAIHGHVSVIEHLAAQQARILAPHKASQMSAIHFAASNGHAATVEHMISEGESLDRESGDGSTPLHFAAKEGHVTVAGMLMKHGADIDAMNVDGHLPVHEAASLAFPEPLLSLLVEHGAELSAQNKKGESAVHMAAQYEWMDGLRYLAEHRVDLSAPDSSGTSPLFWAAQAGNSEVVTYLAQHGVDVDAPIPGGFRPLAVAAGEGHVEVIESLLAAGADANLQSDGKTAREWAEDHDQVAAVKVFAKHTKRRKRKSGSSRKVGDPGSRKSEL